MGFLTLVGGLPDFNKVVLSFWFRVPSESVAAGGYLMSFGAPQSITQTDGNFSTHFYPSEAFPLGTVPVLDSISPTVVIGETAPCYISYVATGDGRFKLKFNFQLATLGTTTNVDFFASSFALDVFDPITGYEHAAEFGSYGFLGPVGVQNTGWNFGGYHVDLGNYDASFPLTSPALLHIDSPVRLLPDRWHHLLLSIDISDGVHCHGSSTPDRFDTISEGFDAYWKVWYAIDDANYNGPDNLGPNYIDGSSDLNAVGNDDANDIADFYTSIPLWNNDVSGPPTYDFDGSVPSSGNDMGIPADSRFTSSIQLIEMAEMQVFTDVTLDTSVVDNRRRFVGADGKPASPVLSEALLGKPPEILLQGRSANWISGTNTGTAGALEATGTITAYSQGPTL